MSFVIKILHKIYRFICRFINSLNIRMLRNLSEIILSSIRVYIQFIKIKIIQCLSLKCIEKKHICVYIYIVQRILSKVK